MYKKLVVFFVLFSHTSNFIFSSTEPLYKVVAQATKEYSQIARANKSTTHLNYDALRSKVLKSAQESSLSAAQKEKIYTETTKDDCLALLMTPCVFVASIIACGDHAAMNNYAQKRCRDAISLVKTGLINDRAAHVHAAPRKDLSYKKND